MSWQSDALCQRGASWSHLKSEEYNGTSGKPQPWRGLPAPGEGLQALSSLVCAFAGLHDATASLVAAPTRLTSSHILRWADTTKVTARPITHLEDTHTITHLGNIWALQPTPTRARVAGRPRPQVPTTCRETATRVKKLRSTRGTHGAMHYP